MKICPKRSCFLRTDTDVMKLRVAFRSFASAPKTLQTPCTLWQVSKVFGPKSSPENYVCTQLFVCFVFFVVSFMCIYSYLSVLV